MSDSISRNNVKELADHIDGQFRASYSGRGMYGKTCVGIVTDQPDEVIASCRDFGLSIPRRDSMGLSTICYWPSIPAEDAEAAQ